MPPPPPFFFRLGSLVATARGHRAGGRGLFLVFFGGRHLILAREGWACFIFGKGGRAEQEAGARCDRDRFCLTTACGAAPPLPDNRAAARHA